jgi:hypothetical protein
MDETQRFGVQVLACVTQRGRFFLCYRNASAKLHLRTDILSAQMSDRVIATT